MASALTMTMSASFPGVRACQPGRESPHICGAVDGGALEDLANGHRHRRVRILVGAPVCRERALDEERRTHLAEHVRAVRGLVVHTEPWVYAEVERLLKAADASRGRRCRVRIARPSAYTR